jgi:hypothetical protein
VLLGHELVAELDHVGVPVARPAEGNTSSGRRFVLKKNYLRPGSLGVGAVRRDIGPPALALMLHHAALKFYPNSAYPQRPGAKVGS